MYQRLLFLFSERSVEDSLNTRELLEGKVVGIEVLNGETHANLNSFFTSGDIDNVSIVSRDQDPDLIHFWGTVISGRKPFISLAAIYTSINWI